MKRFFSGPARPIMKWLLMLSVYGALAAGGYELLKSGDRAIGLGLWSAEPSLDSIDPWERANAAEWAAKKYGGGR